VAAQHVLHPLQRRGVRRLRAQGQDAVAHLDDAGAATDRRGGDRPVGRPLDLAAQVRDELFGVALRGVGGNVGASGERL
jgi:hypothetical protein